MNEAKALFFCDAADCSSNIRCAAFPLNTFPCLLRQFWPKIFCAIACIAFRFVLASSFSTLIAIAARERANNKKQNEPNKKISCLEDASNKQNFVAQRGRSTSILLLACLARADTVLALIAPFAFVALCAVRCSQCLRSTSETNVSEASFLVQHSLLFLTYSAATNEIVNSKFLMALLDLLFLFFATNSFCPLVWRRAFRKRNPGNFAFY